MRLIGVLIVLAIIGLLVKQQLGSGSSSDRYESIPANENVSTPSVPNAPGDVKKFESEMNEFMQDAAKNRAGESE